MLRDVWDCSRLNAEVDTRTHLSSVKLSGLKKFVKISSLKFFVLENIIIFYNMLIIFIIVIR